MIISRTPLRISFFGGGTDYPDYFGNHGGQALSTTIQKYTYITVKQVDPILNFNYRVSYSILESCKELAEIKHPSVRECIRFLQIPYGIEVHIATDLPARTGLGSSSSFTVGFLRSLYALLNKEVSKEQLASEAVHVEQQMIRERVGVQDQYAAAYGGLNHYQFHKDGKIDVHPVQISPDRLNELEKHLMLFYTGVARTAHEILGEQLEKTKKGDNDGELKKIHQTVTDAVNVLTSNGDIREFGKLLHATWESKRKLSSAVTNSDLDKMYESARKAGAIGGKLLGAGGGGFFLFFVEKQNQDEVRNALKGYFEVEVKFESDGSRIIYKM